MPGSCLARLCRERVTDGSHPQAGTCVELFPLSPLARPGSPRRGLDGTYTATGLAAGQYQVYFNDSFCLFCVSSLASQWYNGQPTFATADTVTVTAGSTTRRNRRHAAAVRDYHREP